MTKRIVLDANILIRAVLGKKVRISIEQFCMKVQFFTPDCCYTDAAKYLPILFEKRNLPVEDVLKTLDALTACIHFVDASIYGNYEREAKDRIATRDIDDWPILAAALSLNCPIWTEDADFFGTGVATWTSDRVHLYLNPQGSLGN
jgi:predicted nucleic acid-binding protein